MRDELDGRIPLIVDAGPTMHGIESTIIAIRSGGLEILRRGAVTEEELSDFWGRHFSGEQERAGAGPASVALRAEETAAVNR